jgi:hypothetical protein
MLTVERRGQLCQHHRAHVLPVSYTNSGRQHLRLNWPSNTIAGGRVRLTGWLTSKALRSAAEQDEILLMQLLGSCRMNSSCQLSYCELS